MFHLFCFLFLIIICSYIYNFYLKFYFRFPLLVFVYCKNKNNQHLLMYRCCHSRLLAPPCCPALSRLIGYPSSNPISHSITLHSKHQSPTTTMHWQIHHPRYRNPLIPDYTWADPAMTSKDTWPHPHILWRLTCVTPGNIIMLITIIWFLHNYGFFYIISGFVSWLWHWDPFTRCHCIIIDNLRLSLV